MRHCIFLKKLTITIKIQKTPRNWLVFPKQKDCVVLIFIYKEEWAFGFFVPYNQLLACN